MRRSRSRFMRRQGAIAVLAAVMLVVLLALVAFALDVGYIALVRTEAQAAADSAALAGGQELLSELRVRGDHNAAWSNARRAADEYTSRNRVGPHEALLKSDEDVVVGRLDDPADRTESLDQGRHPDDYNALTVVVRATADRGRQTPLFFAPILGRTHFDMEASATVAFADQISGFRTTRGHPFAPLFPFTLKIDDWNALLRNEGEDNWRYDEQDQTVAPGRDGIRELTMFPTSSGAGNLGTVRIGVNNNGTNVLRRQIREGISAEDLQQYNGALELDAATGTLTLGGNPGVSAGMQSALQDVIGQPRAVLLYNSAEGSGSNLEYTIVGFAGIRIISVDLRGNDKYVLIQPAYVVSPTAVAAPWAPQNRFVTQPVRLVR